MIELPENVKIEEVPIEKRYKSVTAGLEFGERGIP
jgi:hypothetical protein